MKREDTMKDMNKYYHSLIEQFTLLDDTFMRLIFENKECTKLLIRIILDNPTLEIKELQVQSALNNVLKKSVIMDILAIDKNGDMYNIEVQRSNEGANPRRARYHSSILDTHILEKGNDPKNLPNTYIIFITEKDVLGYGKMLYTVNRTIKEVGEEFKDGSNIIYVNTSIQDDSKLGKLMHDFRCSNPQEMNYEILKNQVQMCKTDERKVKDMCRIMEQLREDGRMEGRMEGERKEKINTIINLYKNDVGINIISRAVSISEDEVKEILIKNKILQ